MQQCVLPATDLLKYTYFQIKQLWLLTRHCITDKYTKEFILNMLVVIAVSFAFFGRSLEQQHLVVEQSYLDYLITFMET